MKKRKKKFFVLKIGMFDLSVYFYVNFTDEEQFKHLSKRKKLTDYDKEQLQMDDTVGYNYKTEYGTQVIRLRKFENTPEDIGVLIHEILHCVIDFTERVGIKFSHDSEEVFTYGLEDLLVKALKKLK